MSEREAILQETVLQLRSALQAEPSREAVARLQLGLGLTLHQARLVAAMHEAKIWLPVQRLNLVLGERDHADPRDPRTVKVHIHNIRARLGADAVLGLRDVGYTLGAPGVKACRRVLEGSK